MANEQTRGTSDFATQNTESSPDIRERARGVVDQAKERVSEKIDARVSSSKTRAAETLTGVAETLRSSTQSLRDQNQDGASRAIERAADGVERFANYLQQTDVEDVVDQVHEFARRQPAAFIGGAFALGFLASRFIKATTPSEHRYLAGSTNTGHAYGSTGYGTTRTYENANTAGTRSGISREGGFGNTGDTSGSLGYGAGLSTTGGGSTGGGYTTTPTRTTTDDLGDGTPGLTDRESGRTGGSDAGSR